MKAKNNLIYKIALSLIQGVGDVTAKKLISHCGSTEMVFKDLISPLPGKMFKRKM